MTHYSLKESGFCDNIISVLTSYHYPESKRCAVLEMNLATFIGQIWIARYIEPFSYIIYPQPDLYVSQHFFKGDAICEIDPMIH